MLDGTRDHARTYHLHRLATALDTEGFHATVKSTYPADGPAAGLPDPQGYWPPAPYQERGWDGHGGR